MEVLSSIATMMPFLGITKPASCEVPATVVSGAKQRRRDAPHGQDQLPTTSAQVFQSNVDVQIVSLSLDVKRFPESILSRIRLSQLYHLRGKYRDDLDDVRQAIQQLDEYLGIDPRNVSVLILRASQRLTLHQFSQARSDLEHAMQLDFNTLEASSVAAELDWNAGRYDSAIAAIRQSAKTNPTAQTVARLALLQHDLGQWDIADRSFQKAEDLVVDPNPVFVAWLNLQRGRHKLETGDYDKALPFLREAVRRFPGYVAAREHLAELLALQHNHDEAITIYEAVVQQSNNPEFMVSLASSYRLTGRTKEADTLVIRAGERYETLLEKYPEAMYWHAADFFMGEGKNPARAMELLTRNLAIRPNSASYSSLARAQLHNERLAEAEESMSMALGMPAISAQLFYLASEIYASVGQNDRSHEFARRARQCNPRVGGAPSTKGQFGLRR